MNSHEPMGFDDRVEQAAEAMRELDVPAGPPEELVRRTIARLGGARMSMTPAGGGWRRMRTLYKTAAAAMLAVVAGALAVLALRGGQKQLALSDVIASVKQEQALKCDVRMDVAMPDNTVQTNTAQVVMASRGIVITTMPDVKLVVDGESGRMMMLATGVRTAMVMDIRQSPRSAAQAPPDVLEFLRQLAPAGSAALGEKEIGGIMARGFQSETDGTRWEMWADEKTGKPVRVTISERQGAVWSATYTFSDFAWNPTVDANDIAMKAPDGYQVVNGATVVSNVNGANVQEMLRIAGQLLWRVFPA